MPLVRFKIRNELSLGGPELNRSPAVENEEPKAILSAIEVAGLVGILRQLGDLAEFSAEVFNGIQEEVTVTASRCQKLTSRVRRIESALSPLEKAVLSQTSHIHFAYTAGCEWHPRIRNGHSHFIQSELPLCVMETYEQCRDPPPLHLLDRFDDNGPGSCLRKYSDPTFFKKATSNLSKADDIKVPKNQSHRKRKKKALPQRNICRSNAVSTSDDTNGDRLSSLTDGKQTTSQSTSTVDMPRSSNMQSLSDIVDQSHLQGKSDEQEQIEAQVQSDFQESSKPRESITGSGYIEYVINQSPVNKPDVKLLEGFPSRSIQPSDKIGSAVPESCVEVVDDNILYSPSEDLPVPCASIICDEKKEKLETMVEKTSKDDEVLEIHESRFGPGTPDMVRGNQRDFDSTCILFDEVDIVGGNQSKSQANIIDGTLGIENEGEYKSEQGSEADEFVDARNTIESESESEVDGTPKPNLEHYFGDVSTYCSEDANSDDNDGSEDIPFEEMAQESHHDDSADESFSGSYFPKDANVTCYLSDPTCGKTLSHDENFQTPSAFVAEEAFPDETILQDESVTARPLLAGDCADEKKRVSSCTSLEDAIPAEEILPEEQWANYSFFTKAVPQEKILKKEPVSKYPSLTEVAPSKTFPEKPLPWPLPEALPANKMTSAEELHAGHPSFPEAIQDEKISQEVLNSKILSMPEAVSQERISLEELSSLTKAMPIEEVSPEKPLEVNNSFTELPEENIMQEKADDAMYSSCSKAAPEEKISVEVVDSINVSAVEAIPQEQISFDKYDGIDQSLTEAVPDERFLQEEPVTEYLTKSVASEKVLSEELLETCPLRELPEEKISHVETDDATHLSDVVSDENISPEFFDSTNLSLEEAVPQEEISLEEFVGIDTSLAEPVPDKRFLPEEHLERVVAVENVLPEDIDSPEEKILLEEADDATHLFLSQAVSDEKISPEVLDSTDTFVAKAVPQEQISLDEIVGTDQCLEEAVLDERFLPEEPVTTYLTQAVASKKVSPKDTYPSLTELPEGLISDEETDDPTHPSEAVSDEKISPDVSESTNLSVEDTVLQEQISVEEFVGVNPCLAEAIPDERFSTEEVLREKPLETYPSLEELHEEGDDATHLSEAVDNEKLSPELSDSTNLSLEKDGPQEPIAFVEFVGTNPFLEEAVPDEKVSPEEPVSICLSLIKAAATEGVLPEKSSETYHSLTDFPDKIILDEEADDPTHPSLSEVVNDERISREALDSTNFPVAEAVPKEQISFDDSVGINPVTAEFVPEERVLREESLEMYPSLAEFPEEKSLHEEADDATHPSHSEAVSDEQISPEVLDSTTLPVTESVTQEQISLEEFIGIDPCLSEAVPDKRVSPDEPVTTSLSLTKAMPFEEVLPGESVLERLPKEKTLLEKSDDDDATHPSCAKAVSDENISPENLASTNFSVAKAIPQEQISLEEEFVGIDPCLEEAVTDERVSPEESVTHSSFSEAIGGEFPQEEETDESTRPSFSEVFGGQKISPLKEGPDSTYSSFEESVPHEELVDTNPFSELTVLEEKSFSDEPGSTYQSLEDVSKENNLLEEPLPTYPFSTEAVQDEKISQEAEEPDDDATHEDTNPFSDLIVLQEKSIPDEPSVTYLYPAEAVRDENISLHEPDATCPPSSESVLDEKISDSEESPGSTTETVPQSKTFSEEPPVASSLALADQQVFLDDAAFLSFAEAIFDQKFSPDSPTEPEKPSLVSETKTDDVSMNQNSVVESVSLWSNGGLFGLAPSKPPVFAAPNEHDIKKDESSSSKNSLPLVVSSPTSQQQQQSNNNNMLSHSNGSFRVFGLSHKLLMAGFRGNSSSTTTTTHKFEALPSTSYNTEEDNTTQLDYESSSFFGSPTSSPPVQHMEISFNNTKDVSSVSKLKLSIPSQYGGENADMFQLVPEGSDEDDDDESDTFCQSSSPCVSENCLSDSDLWESDESPRKKEVGETSMGSLSDSFLDLPCFDSVDHHHHQSSSSRLEQEEEEVTEYIPSVSEIIRHWPPKNQSE